MVQGLTAVKNRVQADGQTHVKVGTNWVYRGLPQADKAFWDSFLDNPPARTSLDWMGLDAYPGTFPFANQPASYHDALAADADLMRECFMAYAGIPRSVPIYVEETGWPTSPPARTYASQLTALQQLTAAARDYGRTYNITDFRWFNLRDADSSSPNFQQQFGLLSSTYDPKPAFCAYRTVVTSLTDCPMLSPAASTGPAERAVGSRERPGGQLPPTRTAPAKARAALITALGLTLVVAAFWSPRRLLRVLRGPSSR